MVNVFGNREVGTQGHPGHTGPPGSPCAQGPKVGKGDPGKNRFDAFLQMYTESSVGWISKRRSRLFITY